MTSVSPTRFSNRRMFTRPVVMTWPDSTLVTRVIGRNTRLRPGDLDDEPVHLGPQALRAHHA